MYIIVAKDGIKGICDYPNYVKKKNNIWINGTKDDHEAIAIGGVAYEGAFAKEQDGGELIVNLQNADKGIYIELTESEIEVLTMSQALTDAEIAILELQQQN